MPAYFDTGFSVRVPMWHGQGTVLDDYPKDWADAREKAGLTWEPVELTPYFAWPLSSFDSCRVCAAPLNSPHGDECPLRYGNNAPGVLVHTADIVPAGAHILGEQVMVPDGDHKGIARPDTRLILGVRSDEYSTIYHGREDEFGESVDAAHGRASMEEIMDAFAGDKAIKFETSGSCRDGRQVWALFYLDEPFTVPGDDTEHLSFIAVLNDHSGAGGCKAVNTQVRVVCWNTYQMASDEGERTGRQFTFRHVGDVAGRMAEAVDAIKGLRSEQAAYLEMSSELMKLNVTDESLSKFVQDFLPSPDEHGEVVSDRVRNNVEMARKAFKAIYLDSPTTDSIRGTGFGLLQAGTEYLDHARRYRSSDTYMGRSILGVEPVKAKLLTLVREHAH